MKLKLLSIWLIVDYFNYSSSKFWTSSTATQYNFIDEWLFMAYMLKPWLFMAYTCWKSNKDYIWRPHESRLTLELTPTVDYILIAGISETILYEALTAIEFHFCEATTARFNNRKLGSRPKCIFDSEKKIITHLICKERLEHGTGWVRAARLKILCASLSFILLVVSAFKQIYF